MSIRIVTDSTSDVPDTIITQYGITVVPAYINVGDQSFIDGVDLSRQAFYENLPQYRPHPSTAAPASGLFTETYNRLADEGATAIISIHIAAGLSAYYNSARLGAEATDAVPIHLFDTGQLSLGSGWLSIIAAEAAAAGCSAAQIMDQLDESLPRVRTFAALDTLEYLRRGGRVGWAQFGLGTLLQIKPLLNIGGGDVAILEKVRTRKRSLLRLQQLVAEHAPLERLAILHANARAEAEALRDQLQPYFPADQEQFIAEVTPAIGVHVGPGAVGFTCVQSAAG